MKIVIEEISKELMMILQTKISMSFIYNDLEFYNDIYFSGHDNSEEEIKSRLADVFIWKADVIEMLKGTKL